MAANKPDYPWAIKTTDRLGYTKASREGAYTRTRWLKLRQYVLNESPLCSDCQKLGEVTPATVVDHIIPVKDSNDILFYDITNLATLCDKCHRRKTKISNSKYSTQNLENGKILMNDLSK